jgi:hypothetical protein
VNIGHQASNSGTDRNDRSGFRWNDFDSHAMAVGWSQLSQPFLVKLLHQILPIGMLIHKYKLVKYTIDCPTCWEHIETHAHLFQCHHPSCAGWKTQLKNMLIKFTDKTNCHHLLQDILVTGIHNWIHGLPFQHTGILRIGRSWSIVSLRLDGNNFSWADSPWNGWSIRNSIFKLTRNHLPTLIMVHRGWAPWSSGSGSLLCAVGVHE